eukprot:scaffold24203_cov30-Tisochrysis_lutea.AAC.2
MLYNERESCVHPLALLLVKAFNAPDFDTCCLVTMREHIRSDVPAVRAASSSSWSIPVGS